VEKVVEASNIRYSVGSCTILDGVDISVQRGVFYSVVGPNGSGKTTLLNVLSGVVKPQEGEIKLMGRDIFSMSKRGVAKRVAVLPQNTEVLFDFCVFDVLLMGRHPYRGAIGSITDEDLRLVDKVAGALGLESLLDRPMTRVSGGERQRCLLGRVIVQDTPIVFLDEATSNLDPFYTHEILGRMREMVTKDNVTVVSVFHNLNLAVMYSDYIFFMKDGKIPFEGDVRNVVVPEVVESVFSVKVRVLLDKEYPYPIVIPDLGGRLP